MDSSPVLEKTRRLRLSDKKVEAYGITGDDPISSIVNNIMDSMRASISDDYDVEELTSIKGKIGYRIQYTGTAFDSTIREFEELGFRVIYNKDNSVILTNPDSIRAEIYYDSYDDSQPDEDSSTIITITYSNSKPIADSHNRRSFSSKSGRSSRKLESAYRGLNISPMRPFTRTDYYGYSGASKIGSDEPLIYSGDLLEIVISGEETDGYLCSIQVFIGEDQDFVYGIDALSLQKALRLGKLIASKDGTSVDEIVDFIEDNTDFIQLA